MYEQFQQDMEKARAKFHVISQLQDGETGPRDVEAEFTDGWTTRQVEAEAGTGSRYVVVATRLGKGGFNLGGPILVTVMWPWQDAWTLAEGGYLDEFYVAEHLTADRYLTGRLHGGDLAALTMTIQHTLSREGDE